MHSRSEGHGFATTSSGAGVTDATTLGLGALETEGEGTTVVDEQAAATSSTKLNVNLCILNAFSAWQHAF
jgi:hypothetical protein